MAALNGQGRLRFRLFAKRICSGEVIDFLDQILQIPQRRHLVIVMDQAKPYTSQLTTAYIEGQRPLHVFSLPKYSPDWTPDEKVWNHPKHQERKAYKARTRDELKDLTQRKLKKMSTNPSLLRGIFFRCCVADFFGRPIELPLGDPPPVNLIPCDRLLSLMELVIFIGLQGTGKSSFYRARLAQTHVLVSKDRLRNNRRPARRQRQLIEEALQAGQSVVVDNTNPTAAERAELVELARRHGATVTGYYFESRLEDCLERNRQRTGKERIPDVALFAVARKLERPSYAEGFDRLFHVRLTSDNQFAVQEWAYCPTSDEPQ